MSRESKKPIEKMLKASARMRRAEFGADPKMPNPMRAHLHDEIARVAREAEAPVRRSWLAIFWPQLSLAGAAAAVLLTLAVFWFERDKNSGSQMQLATRSLAVTGSLEQPSEQLRSLDQSSRLSENGAKNLDKNEAAVAAAPAAPAQEFVAARNSAATVSRSAQVARGQAMRNYSPANQSGKILENFQVEQNGKEIRLVDADGSTYSGTFQRETPAADAARPRKMKVKPEISSQPNEQFFRASGFNNSLKKPVIFEGSYIPPPAAGGKPAGNDKLEKAQQESAARIVGIATAPGEAPIEVDAASSSP